AIINEKRKIPVVLWQRIPLFWILHRNQPLFVEITPDKVPRGNRHPFEYACADHSSCRCRMLDARCLMSERQPALRLKSSIQYPVSSIGVIDPLPPSQYRRFRE